MQYDAHSRNFERLDRIQRRGRQMLPTCMIYVIRNVKKSRNERLLHLSLRNISKNCAKNDYNKVVEATYIAKHREVVIN